MVKHENKGALKSPFYLTKSMHYASVKWSNDNERSFIHYFNSRWLVFIAGLYLAKIWGKHLTCPPTTGGRKKD
jgi:hypothetical protein